MKFRRYNFPHPILNHGSDFKKGDISCKTKVTPQNETRSYEFHVNINNLLISKLVETGRAILVAEIACSYTMYRQKFTSLQEDKFSLKFNISNDHLRNKVDVKVLVVANEDIPQYTNDGFNDWYDNAIFTIEYGDVLGLCDHFTDHIDFKGDSISNFLVLKETTEHRQMQIDLNKDSVFVLLPKKQIEDLKSFVHNPDFNQILISNFLTPVLYYALSKLNEEFDDQFRDKKWFETLKLINKQKSDNEYIQADEIPKRVQEIMHDPNNSLINKLIYLNDRLSN